MNNKNAVEQITEADRLTRVTFFAERSKSPRHATAA